MNVDTALQSFRDEASDPREALQWALDHWDEASDRLLSKLRMIAANLADDPEDKSFSDDDGSALFCLVHLFAEKRDKRAYAPLCERLLRDKDSNAWLGDGVTISLPGVLINLYDGDLEPIQRVIERRGADEFVRGSALQAFAYLVRIEKAADEQAAREYLRRLYEEAEPRKPSWLWAAWSEVAALLGFQDFGPMVAKLLSKNWIDSAELAIQDFSAILAKARSDPEKAFADDGVKPFESTTALIDEFAGSRDEDGASGDRDYDERSQFATPHVNPLREVGRNDPCPCGSGKKYKKCCLAA